VRSLSTAFAVYMTPYPRRPYQRTAEVLNERAGLAISPGTLQRTVRVAAARLEAPATAIRAALVAAPVAPADETGRRVNGNLYRLHVLSTNRLTACFPHPKRGAEALDAFGLLSQFVGILGHHHRSAYERYQCLHAFCKVHHLRQLIAIAERSPSRPWATDMITLFRPSQCPVGEVQDQDLETLPAGNGEHLRDRYDTILSTAEAGNPPRPRRPGTRGRVTQSPAGNLMRRLRERRNEVLRFLTDLRSLRQQPCRTRPSHAQARAESLWLLPLQYRRRGLCHHPLLPLNSPQTVRRYVQLARPDLPRATPNAPVGVAERLSRPPLAADDLIKINYMFLNSLSG